ncbi:hypothetical protein [Caenimonas soli]|uniref:hypothetical protein n=1 Tax=Caenimonas soli TaxID=2735555 RepID=UPI0015553EBB|nr:hypothetical protein [Caenimonas soli]NPC59391.1 hypothetical protein [Caenimonas soli]
MRIKSDTCGYPAEEPVPGSAHEREVFVIENLTAESGACATHQLTIYRFSESPPTAGVIDVSVCDVAPADGAAPETVAGFVTRFGGDATVLGTPATGGLALLYRSPR